MAVSFRIIYVICWYGLVAFLAIIFWRLGGLFTLLIVIVILHRRLVWLVVRNIFCGKSILRQTGAEHQGSQKGSK